MSTLMVTPQDAQELIEATKAGDRQAFERIVVQEGARIRALVVSRLNAHIVFGVAVDDVYQETLLRAYESIKAFEWKGTDSFLHWIGGIAENVILHLGRKRARERQAPFDGDVAAGDISPSRALRREERFQRLTDALQKLSSEHREVITLLRLKGFTFDQAAAQMGRSRDAVKKLLYRALQQLKARFGDTESLHLPDNAYRQSEDEDRA